MVRIGVIGVGFGAKVQIPAFQAEGFDVVAVCSRQESRVGHAAKTLGIPHTYTDYRSMLEKSDLDAVSIVTPANLHYEITMATLAAGKHVLCEKPFAMDQTQAKAMVDKARSTRRTAMVAHEFRFSPARAYVKELVGQGYIGALQTVSTTVFLSGQPSAGPPGLDWRQRSSQGGGQLGRLGSHYIDCLRDWFGEITSVSGQVFSPETHLQNADTPDDAFAILMTFASGGWGSLIANFSTPLGSRVRTEIYGTDGTLCMTYPDSSPPPDGRVLGARHADAKNLQELPIPERFHVKLDGRDERLGAFRVLARRFRQGIEDGASPAPSFQDGYCCQQVIDAVRNSNGAGKWVEIEQ